MVTQRPITLSFQGSTLVQHSSHHQVNRPPQRVNKLLAKKLNAHSSVRDDAQPLVRATKLPINFLSSDLFFSVKRTHGRVPMGQCVSLSSVVAGVCVHRLLFFVLIHPTPHSTHPTAHIPQHSDHQAEWAQGTHTQMHPKRTQIQCARLDTSIHTTSTQLTDPEVGRCQADPRPGTAGRKRWCLQSWCSWWRQSGYLSGHHCETGPAGGG